MSAGTSLGRIGRSAEQLLPSRAHPNYRRWRSYHQAARRRGELAAELLATLLPHRSVVLDVGCGVGGTSVALACRGAVVLALERDRRRLDVTDELAEAARVQLTLVQGDGTALPFKDGRFDALILQDVLEHVSAPGLLLQEAARTLRKGGLLFLVTPNRWSPCNVLSDPHWGLPLVAALPRWAVALLTRRRRAEGPEGSIVPALLSLRSLRALMQEAGLVMNFVNRAAARLIALEPRAAFCAPWHLRLAHWAKRAGVLHWLPRLVSDRMGAFNWWLNPAWYIVAQKQ
ncbi:MAG: class I SAM-dependent methyltransferase [candidate division KSB1 bacterium]|nr:class I SAM-dependent methyltransferase [candidate division KSB1 bacterium]